MTKSARLAGITRPTIIIGASLLLVIGGLAYWLLADGEETATTFAVVETVDRGTVSSGIQTTGQIVAAQKLDLNVYKQAARIEAVNVQNGGRVEKGQVLISFDKSSASVAAQSSRVAVTEAALSLAEAKENATDPNTQLRTLQNDIAALDTSIAQAQKDKVTAYRTYLNADLSTEPSAEQTVDKTRPILSGLYTGTTEGEYRIRVYKSNADSGYSFQTSGLESYIGVVYPGTAVPLGSRGLTISFPSDLRHDDGWIVAVPNVRTGAIVENKDTYNKAIANLDKSIEGYRVDQANKKQELENLSRTDTSTYRDLTVSKAEAELAKAQVSLSENYEVVREQDIIAPFSGTIDGLENVVVGASPTRESTDSISFGTLISDEFLVTFSLGAVDVTKVKVGQKVIVTVPSFPNTEPLTAVITEISSLPEGNETAQYEVKAALSVGESSIPLREGILADIEVVQEEVAGVLRIPVSALSFAIGKTTVQVVEGLSEEQQETASRLGIVRLSEGTLPSYPVEVTVGVRGSYWAEIKSGLDEGMLIVVSKTEEDASAVQTNVRFGGPPPEGGGNGGEGGAQRTERVQPN